jgi:hypothetical protein
MRSGSKLNHATKPAPNSGRLAFAAAKSEGVLAPSSPEVHGARGFDCIKLPNMPRSVETAGIMDKRRILEETKRIGAD